MSGRTASPNTHERSSRVLYRSQSLTLMLFTGNTRIQVKPAMDDYDDDDRDGYIHIDRLDDSPGSLRRTPSYLSTSDAWLRSW